MMILHIIFECNDCFCDANCKLRISRETYGQLELFYTSQDKGWGIRSRSKILVGAAFCEYIEMLRSKENEVDAEGDNYYSYNIMCLQLVREVWILLVLNCIAILSKYTEARS